MRTPMAFLKFVARAVLNAVSFGVAGDFVVEVLPEMARDVWRWWGQDRAEEELRAEVQAVAQLPPAEARRLAEQAAAAEAADRPEPVRRALAGYLAQVPAAVRRSQRRPADPTGRTVVSGLSLGRADDLLPLLPSQAPRFRPGDRPPGIGDWELEELLGVGGFGEVWRARNPHLAEPVALKFCLDPAAARALRNEAALLGRVMSQGKHPGIVRLLHTYLSAETPCLEYEYVAGGDLAGLIAQWHRFPAASLAEQATRLMHRLADIVAFAHRLDPPIVHRDLKPANILLQPLARGAVSLRVTDFGIGGVAAHQVLAQGRRAATRPLTRAVRGAHTPLYASPQQMRDEPPDPRDDVHALGVIWYQLLTGDLSLLIMPADWQEELAERRVPEAVVRLLGACLASRADRRPADAAVLAAELAGLMGRRLANGDGAPPYAAPGSNGRKAPPEEDLAARVDRTLRLTEEAHLRARQRAERDRDFAGAVDILEEVPLPLRDAELYVALCERRDRVARLDRQLREAVQEGRFARLRPVIEELLALAPHREDLRRLLDRLPEKRPLGMPVRPPLPVEAIAPPPRVDFAALPRRRTNRLGMKLALVPAGSFWMGSPATEAQRSTDEGPRTKVLLSRPFYLGVYPVTQREYAELMGSNPSHFTAGRGGGPDHPVENVSWKDAARFCRQLALLAEELVPGWGYRLPTEAEWEYACRAGTESAFAFGDSLSWEQANLDGRHPYGGARKGPSLGRTSRVGSYPANAWGLCDLHGNVWEWCADWYAAGYSGARLGTDPQGPPGGEARVLRGGAWNCGGRRCRSACRCPSGPDFRSFAIGFRVVLAP